MKLSQRQLELKLQEFLILFDDLLGQLREMIALNGKCPCCLKASFHEVDCPVGTLLARARELRERGLN